jgi:hypothetical protein
MQDLNKGDNNAKTTLASRYLDRGWRRFDLAAFAQTTTAPAASGYAGKNELLKGQVGDANAVSPREAHA